MYEDVDIGAFAVLTTGARAKGHDTRPRRRGVCETSTDLVD
jgi:hypothetical protein